MPRPHRPLLGLLSLIAGGLATTALPAAGPPENGPATEPAPSPIATSTPPIVDADHVRLSLLTSRAAHQLAARQFDDARDTLTQALAIDPADPTNLYALARLDALTDHPVEAVDALRRSVDHGFSDFIRLVIDRDLGPLRGRTDYRALIDHQPLHRRQAAERALADLRRQFGDGYLYDVDEQHKFVFATHTGRPALDALERDLNAQANSQWDQLFPHHPAGYTKVVVPTPADYARLRQGPGVLGFYAPSIHTLVASGLGSVTTHEFTHALHMGDLEETGQQHPLWVTEGLAVLFEQAAYKGDVLTPQPNQRLAEVLVYKQVNRLVRLPVLLRLRPDLFMAHAGLCYAESGALMAYLYDQKLLRTFYDSFKADYDHDPTGRTALELATGHPLPMIERDWWQWLRTQQPPPRQSNAWLGVDFAQAPDGLVAIDVTPDSPAAKAGLKVDDVLVGLNGLEVRDRVTFVPLLAVHKPGETVTFNVRRGEDYLALPVVLGTHPPR